METAPTSTITVAFMNIRGQTGLDEAKQVQIENFVKSYKKDILNCQEINIKEDTFKNCNYLASSYNLITNNAPNKYGTCCLVSNSFEIDNIKLDTKGRVITFNIDNITFCNVYLPSGTDPVMKYSREIIPQILINAKDTGCIGGDWNNIVDARDATKTANKKQSSSLKRLIKTFSWIDSFRQLHPNAQEFSRYYDNSVHGDGASRLDRMYHFGHLVVLQARYVGIAFSDHFALIVKFKVPENLSTSVSPKSKPMFKSKPDIIKDPIFQTRLKEVSHNGNQ